MTGSSGATEWEMVASAFQKYLTLSSEEKVEFDQIMEDLVDDPGIDDFVKRATSGHLNRQPAYLLEGSKWNIDFLRDDTVLDGKPSLRVISFHRADSAQEPDLSIGSQDALTILSSEEEITEADELIKRLRTHLIMITEHKDTPIVVQNFVHNTVMDDVDALARLMTEPLPEGSDVDESRSTARVRLALVIGALMTGGLWLNLQATYRDELARLAELLGDLPPFS